MHALLVHPGTQHARHLARELHVRGMLTEFWTGIGFAPGSLYGNLARAAGRLPGLHGLASRQVPGVPPERIHTTPLIELLALARLRWSESLPVIHHRNESFQQAIPDRVLRAAGAIIGFDTSSWILARRAAHFGRPLLLERTIAHPQAHDRIMRELAARYPAWGAAVEPRLPCVTAAEEAEHTLAHRIVVGSPVVARSLEEAGVAGSKICLNPYGVDWERFATPTMERKARPLRFLFAGSVNARKGVPLLLEAWRALPPGEAELWLAGRASEQVRKLIPALPGLRLLGGVPHQAMPAIYAQCDVFVLPTYFEGFSLVVLEALAAGLPVITTPNSGAESLLTDPALGRLIPAGDLEALVAALRHYAGNPPHRPDTVAAAGGLRERFSWGAYGDRWAQLLSESV